MKTPPRPHRPDQPAPAGRPKPPHASGPRPSGPTRFGAGTDIAVLWGFHAVSEALASPGRQPLRLYATAAAAVRLEGAAAARSLAATVLDADEIGARLPRDAVHQGVVLEARPLDAPDLSDLPDEGTVLVLDQITDPHNVGAILRTAAAFGVAALVTTERHAPEMTGVLAKAASGGLEYVPVVSIVNLARALDAMRARGYQLVGLDSDGATPLEEVTFAPARALVLGAEGKGLRRLTRERCETVARLDMPGPIRSLNVSNACAVALTILRLRTRQ